nr:hypothetical protein [Chlamydiota bacterium]
ENQNVLETVDLNETANKLDNQGKFKEMLEKAREAELTIIQILSKGGEDSSITIQLAYALYHQSGALISLFYQSMANDPSHASQLLDLAYQKANEGLELKPSDQGIKNLLNEKVRVISSLKSQLNLDSIGTQLSNGDETNAMSLLLKSVNKV